MHNEATVLGYVADIITDDKATLLVIEDRTGDKVRSSVARCWSDKSKAAASEIKVGSLVKVSGYISSNKSTQGRWFSEFSASFIKVLSADTGEF